MSALLTKPLCNKEDLGKPIPNDDHAISMCLPTWRSVVGYEERDKEIMGSIQLGYPRFLYHPLIEKAIGELIGDFQELKALSHQLYPTQKTAKRAYDFILKHHPNIECIITETNQQAFILSYPKECEEIAKCYWQHTGEGISSRHAKYILSNKTVPSSDKAYEAITSKISASLDVDTDNIYLFPNGMAAIYMAMRLLQKIHPERSFSQFCFPLKLESFARNIFQPLCTHHCFDKIKLR